MTTYATKEFRETSIPWLPRVPKGWEVRKMKYLFKERSEKGFPNEPPLAATQNMGVVPKKVYGQRTVEVSKDFDKLKLVRKGDFVISLRSFQGGIELAYYQGIISPAYTILTPNGEIQTPYFKHLAKSAPFIGLLRQCVTGIREGQNIDYSILRKNLLPIPPVEEQCAIAAYLDEKCGKIDKLIEVKEGEVGLLCEMKQSVIGEAVTRGLRGGALRASSIPWLPLVPEGWKIASIGRLFEIQLGKMLCPSKLGNDYTLEPYYCALNVHADGIDDSKIKDMWFSPSEKQRYEIKVGDLLIVEGGSVGVCALVKRLAKPTYIQNSILRVRSKGFVTNEFLRYYMLALVQTGYMNAITSKTTFAHFTKEKASMTPCLYPPVEEQEEIVGYLDKKCGELDKAVEALEKQVEHLKELKQSMIADFVTGKRRVQL